VKLYKQVLEARMRVLGPEDPLTVRAMANLTLSYRGSGWNQEGLELDEQVLEIRKRILGPEDPDTLKVTTNLADSYYRVDRMQEASSGEKEEGNGR
jgi:hypothetical protein